MCDDLILFELYMKHESSLYNNQHNFILNDANSTKIIMQLYIPYIRKYRRSLNLAISPKSGRNALLVEFKFGGFCVMSLYRYHCTQF